MIPLTPAQQQLAAEAYPVLRRRRIIDRDGRGVFGLLEAARRFDGSEDFLASAMRRARWSRRNEWRDEHHSRLRHPVQFHPLLVDPSAPASEVIEARDLVDTIKRKCPDETALLREVVSGRGARARIAIRHDLTPSRITQKVNQALRRCRKAIGLITLLLAVLLPATSHAALKWIDLTARPDWSTLSGTYTPTVWFDDGTGFPGLAADSQQTADTMAELGPVTITASTQPSLDATAPTFARGDDTITISSLGLLDSTATYDGLFAFDLALDHPEIIDHPITLTSAGNPDVSYTLSDAPMPEPGPVLLWLGIGFAWVCRDGRRRKTS